MITQEEIERALEVADVVANITKEEIIAIRGEGDGEPGLLDNALQTLAAAWRQLDGAEVIIPTEFGPAIRITLTLAKLAPSKENK